MLDDDDPAAPVQQFALATQRKDTNEAKENPNLNLEIPQGQFKVTYTKSGVPLKDIDDSLLAQTSEGSWASKSKRRSR